MPVSESPQRPHSSDLKHRAATAAAVLGGGLLGSLARASIALAFPIAAGELPATTLAINLVGSTLLGFYLARSRRASSPRWLLPFWAIGCLGAFTTFSTFSVEVFDLLASGAVTTAVSYVVLSTVGGVVAALLGQRVGSVGR